MSHRAHFLLPILVIACRTRPQTITPHEVAAISPASGAVSSKLIPDQDSPSVKLGLDEDYVEPHLSPRNNPPAYPPDLIPLQLTPYTIVVRVIFDESGRVFEIAHSPLATSTEGQYRTAFEAAVKQALQQWRCSPPRIRKFRPGPDADGDGKPDYRILASQRVLKTFFDVSFSFEVVNGQPVVRSAAPK